MLDLFLEILEEIFLRFSSLLMLYFVLFSAFGTIVFLVKAYTSIKMRVRRVKWPWMSY
ncbi:MAG: hypothetical protein QW738_00200 [Nitrososphaeria archaeon]